MGSKEASGYTDQYCGVEGENSRAELSELICEVCGVSCGERLGASKEGIVNRRERIANRWESVGSAEDGGEKKKEEN